MIFNYLKGAVTQFILTISLSLIVSMSYAGNLEKGFEALKVFNYFEAKTYFEKVIKKQPAGAAYGLSIIFYRDDNPFHQIDSAYKYILESKKAFSATELKEREKLKEVGVTKRTIETLEEKINIRAFEYAKKENTIIAYTKFLNTYKHSTLEQQARNLKSSLAFSYAKQKNTVEAFKNFIDSFPQSPETKDARWLYNLSLFNSFANRRDIKVYEQFIQKHPDSPFLSHAQDSIYELSTPGKSKAELLAYIKKYPRFQNIKRAWELLYSYASSDFTPQSLTNFLFDFPDFPEPKRVQEDILLSKTTFYAVRSNNKWGFVDSTGHIWIECKYDWVDDFNDGMALAAINDSVGYIHKNGKWAIEPQYEEAHPFKAGYAIVGRKELFGLIDRTGRLIIPIQEEDLSNDGPNETPRLFRAFRNGVTRYYSTAGAIVVESKMEKAGDFHSGMAYYVLNGKYGFLNTNGKTIIQPKYDWAENFKNGLARVMQANKYGLIDTSGRMLINCEYDRIDEFNEGHALIIKDGKFGLVNREGRIAVDIKYPVYAELSASKGLQDGLIKIERLKKRGMIDLTGKEVVPVKFDDLRTFNEGLCAVRIGKWGYIDLKNKTIIAPAFDYAWDFKEGLARVKLKEKIGFIDRSGKIVIKTTYDEATDFEDGMAIVTLAGKKGLMDRAGALRVPIEYDEILRRENGIFRIRKNDPDDSSGEKFRFGWYHRGARKIVWAEEGL